MKVTNVRGVALSVLIVGGLLLVFAVSCSFEERQAEREPVERQIEEETFVANPFCYACHADFQGETLEARHAKAGIGCERCHGESERHRSDEANITPPELMYPRTRVNPTCMICHPRDTIKQVDSHDVILADAKTIFDEKDPEGPEKVCTDCHAPKHKMGVRTVRWNKATGEILQD